jgi:hypothetical protein
MQDTEQKARFTADRPRYADTVKDPVSAEGPVRVVKLDDPVGSHRIGTLFASWEDVRNTFGEGWCQTDGYKVDHRWHLRCPDTDEEAMFWNYKNGPSYAGESMDGISSWSVYGDGHLLARCLNQGVEFVEEEEE